MIRWIGSFLFLYCGIAHAAAGRINPSMVRPASLSWQNLNIVNDLTKRNFFWHTFATQSVEKKIEQLDLNSDFIYSSIENMKRTYQDGTYLASSKLHPFNIVYGKGPFFIYNQSQQKRFIFKYKKWDDEILKTYIFSPEYINHMMKNSTQLNEKLENLSAIDFFNMVKKNKKIVLYQKFYSDFEISLPSKFVMLTKPTSNNTFLAVDESLLIKF